MTYLKLAAVGAALIISAVAVSSAQARPRHHHLAAPRVAYETGFDRHGPMVWGFMPQQTAAIVPRVHKRGRGYADPAPVTKTRVARSEPQSYGGHPLVAKSGARASVSTAALPHFQCLLGKLEGAGYKIDFMGGYASRGNSSAHPTGNALDINQTGRNRVTRALPYGATAMAQSCGLVHGAVWSNPDGGHFEMANKYGYIYGGTHYAYRYRHRHYAMR